MDKYYVYLYLRGKMSRHGQAGTPYYVGKGCGKRAWVRQGLNDRNIPKDKSRIVIFKENIAEREAFIIEKMLILKYGRIDIGTGCLWNRTEGGDGCRRPTGRPGKPKPPRTPEHTEKLRQANIGRVQSAEEKERRAAKLRGRKRVLSPEWLQHIKEAGEAKRGKHLGGRPKGIPAWNKGVKGFMKPNKTSFQPGFTPWNAGKKGVMGTHWSKLDRYRDRVLFKKAEA